MALDLKLFEKVESGKGLFAVESINLIYNILTTILILLLYSKMDHPGLMIVERGVIAAMTFLMIYMYQIMPCRLTVFVRMVIQMSLLAYWYPDTYEFNRIFDNLDYLFASADQFLFGCQPAVEFCSHFPSMWISEPLHMGYFFYYPMMLIVVVYYFLFHYEWFEKVCFVLMTSFFIYYLVYLLVPVAGPQFYFPAIGMDKVNACDFTAIGDYFRDNSILLPSPGYDHGFFYNLVEASQEVGERPTAAFPSSHVGISTILMIMSFRVSRKLSYTLMPFYLLLCMATVYIQAHYLIDSICGFITAFPVYKMSSIMYKKWFVTPTFRVRM